MKKFLLGLVVAVMMTGSGYAKTKIVTNSECQYLLNEAGKYAYGAKVSDNLSLTDQKYERIKNAHYFAVTWSVLCD